MKAPRTARLIAMTIICGVGFSFSLLALIALNGGGSIRLGRAALIPLAAGYDRHAQSRVAASETPPSAIRGEALRASNAAVAQFPYDTGAWLRLAYLDTLEHGKLSPTGASALARSYDLIAVDPDFGVWRVAFALEQSEALDPAVRTSVREEVGALWEGSRDRPQLRNLQKQLRNPAGRLSLILWINRLEANSAK